MSIKDSATYAVQKFIFNPAAGGTDCFLEATEAQRAKVEECAKEVLVAREKFHASTLADLYDPVTMPPALAKAHESESISRVSSEPNSF